MGRESPPDPPAAEGAEAAPGAAMRADAIARRLRENGFALTPQRRAIVRHLAERGGHWTASQLLTRLTEALPQASRATVYATLSLLRDLGALTEVPGPGGEVLFDANPEPHQHFRCTRCDRLEDVPDHWFPISVSPDRPAGPAGFEVERFQVVALGRCPDCR